MGKFILLVPFALGAVLSLSLTACEGEHPQGKNGSTGQSPADASQTSDGADPDESQPNGQDSTGPADPTIPGLKEHKSALPRSTPEVAAPDKAALRDGNRELSFELLRNSGKATHENAAVSAISMRAAFGLVHAMAKGDTQKEIAKAMGFLEDPEKTQAGINDIEQTLLSRNLEKASGLPPVLTSSGNRIFVNKGMMPSASFLDTLAKNYGAGVYETDFENDPKAAREAINSWVSEKTFRRIPSLLPEGTVTPTTNWILTNTLYFKAPWATSMQPSENIEFTLANSKKISVDGISNNQLFGNYGTGPNFEWAQIPLRDEKLGAIIILPEAQKYAEVEASMSAKTIEDMIAKQEFGEIDVTMPKFQINTGSMDYTKYLQKSMPKTFENADFGGYDEIHRPESISSVFHSVFLAADEHGIEAAAATANDSAGSDGGPSPDFKLSVNRPFMFLVYDNPSGLILFAGRVMNPSVE